MNRVCSLLIVGFLLTVCALSSGCATQRTPSTNTNAAQAPAAPAASKPPTVGGIKIASTPSGATVLLMATDEAGASPPEPRGTTPTTITDLSPGKYAVHLELKGYKSFQKEVDVKAGEVTPFIATLKK